MGSNNVLVDDLWDFIALVHGWWFDLDKIEHDEQSRELRIPLGLEDKGPYKGRTLVITDVEGITIRDEAEIGIYDISDIRLALKKVIVIASAPLMITATVGEGARIQVQGTTETFTLSPGADLHGEWGEPGEPFMINLDFSQIWGGRAIARATQRTRNRA